MLCDLFVFGFMFVSEELLRVFGFKKKTVKKKLGLLVNFTYVE